MTPKNKTKILVVSYEKSKKNKNRIKKLYCACCEKDLKLDESLKKELEVKLAHYLSLKETPVGIELESEEEMEKYLHDYQALYQRVYVNGEVLRNYHQDIIKCPDCESSYLCFNGYQHSSDFLVFNELHLTVNEKSIQVVSYEKYYQLQVCDREDVPEDIFTVDHYRKMIIDGVPHRIFNFSFAFIDERIKEGKKEGIDNIIHYQRLVTHRNIKKIINFNKQTKQINANDGFSRFNLNHSVIDFYRKGIPLPLYYLFYKQLFKEYNIPMNHHHMYLAIKNILTDKIYYKDLKRELIKHVKKLTIKDYQVLNPLVEVRYMPQHIRKEVVHQKTNYQALQVLYPGLTKGMMKHANIFYLATMHDLKDSVGIKNPFEYLDDEFFDEYETYSDFKYDINLVQFIVFSLSDKNIVLQFLKIIDESNNKSLPNTSKRELMKTKQIVCKYFPRFEKYIHQFAKNNKNNKNKLEILSKLENMAEFLYIILKTEKSYQNYLSNQEHYTKESIENINKKIDFIFKNNHKMNYQTLHDNLSTLNFYFVNDFVEYKYSKKELKYVEVIDDIEFCLPKNNFILHDIGNKMNHCVGTYDTLVRNKRATIIYLKKDNEYILCLEIRNKEIIQAKKKYNEILDIKEKEDKKVKDILLKYLKKHNISNNICLDL